MTKAKAEAEAGDAVAAAAAGLMPAGVAWDHDDHDGWRMAAAAAVSYCCCCCQSRHVIHLTRAAMRDEFVDAIQSVACLRRDVQSVCVRECVYLGVGCARPGSGWSCSAHICILPATWAAPPLAATARWRVLSASLRPKVAQSGVCSLTLAFLPLGCTPSKSTKWRSLLRGWVYPSPSSTHSACLCLLSILSLTSFASFCLRFRSRFF